MRTIIMDRDNSFNENKNYYLNGEMREKLHTPYRIFKINSQNYP